LTFTPRKAQYVRAYFVGGIGNMGCAHIVEMQARDDKGNVLKPVAVTSSGDDQGHPVSFAADGNTDKGRAWWSDRDKPLPAWVAFDFETPQTISSVWLLTYWDGKRWYDYAIEVSDDGQEWTAVTQRSETPTGPVNGARALADIDFTDGTVGVTTLEFEAQRSGAGIWFRCPDERNGYVLRMEPRWDGNLVLDKLVAGKLKRIAAVFFPWSIHNPIPHRLRVECEGSHIKCYGDERLVLEADDDTFAAGKVGLIVPGGHQVKFSRFTVE